MLDLLPEEALVLLDAALAICRGGRPSVTAPDKSSIADREHSLKVTSVRTSQKLDAHQLSVLVWSESTAYGLKGVQLVLLCRRAST